MIADEALRSQHGFGGKVNQTTGEMSCGFASNLRKLEMVLVCKSWQKILGFCEFGGDAEVIGDFDSGVAYRLCRD